MQWTRCVGPAPYGSGVAEDVAANLAGLAWIAVARGSRPQVRVIVDEATGAAHQSDASVILEQLAELHTVLSKGA